MKKTLFIVGFVIASLLTFADSPLTSTPFYKAYETNSAVKHALESGLDKTTLAFIGSNESSIIDKIAVINALSWGNAENIKVFEKYLLENRKGLKKEVFDSLLVVPTKAPTENELTLLLTADDLTCWAYLLTMGDYNNPAKGMRAAYLGYTRDQESMANVVPYSLIGSQCQFDISWCKVYQISNTMLVETQYTKNNISAEALKIIMDYINLYREECK